MKLLTIFCTSTQNVVQILEDFPKTAEDAVTDIQVNPFTHHGTISFRLAQLTIPQQQWLESAQQHAFDHFLI